MALGLIVLVAGGGLILLGGFETRRRVTKTWGGIDANAMRQSQGTGVVPPWVSAVVLLGWLGAVVGVVMILVGLVM